MPQEHVVRLAAVEALSVLFEKHQVVIPNQLHLSFPAFVVSCGVFNIAGT